jgi:hypothetical protein
MKLKQVRYNSKSEALFLIIGSVAFCGFWLYMILNGANSSVIAIIGIVFFGSNLSIGIRQLLKKKTADVVNVNGWQYKLFKKGKKFRFILISGLYKSSFVFIVLCVVWVIQHEKVVSVNEILGYIAGVLIVSVILIPLSGYLEYKKFCSMENTDDKMFIFPKDKTHETDTDRKNLSKNGGTLL